MATKTRLAGLELLTPPETADILGVTEARLQEWRRDKCGPPFYRYGKQIRYDASELRAWLDSKRVPA